MVEAFNGFAGYAPFCCNTATLYKVVECLDQGSGGPVMGRECDYLPPSEAEQPVLTGANPALNVRR